jgi:hypothetical protein
MEDKILETVVNNLEYTFEKDVLVKPLEPVMVKKDIITQIPTGEKDEDGFEKYETKTETKDVESEFLKGVVLALPTCLTTPEESTYKVGSTVVYNKKFAKDFDLYKNSQLVKPYDVIAVVNK